MSVARRADRRVGRPRPGDQGRSRRVVLGRTFWDSLRGPDECRGRPPERGTFMGERTGCRGEALPERTPYCTGLSVSIGSVPVWPHGATLIAGDAHGASDE
jgi:hypothetical protein